MAPPILLLQDIHLNFGRTTVLDGAELSGSEGDRLCLVGRNGSGKSTLLKTAAGLMEADGGTRFAQPVARIGYLPQEPTLAGFADTRAYVEAGLAPGDDPNGAFYLLGKVGLDGTEATDRLSGGEARRAALARVLAPSPDVLLLDEPTNHLDLPAIQWLEEELQSLSSALVLISHDRRFLENISRENLWLDPGFTRRLDRGFAGYEAWRDEVLAQEERDAHKLDRKIAMELDWVRYGVTARRKRNQRRMAELGELRRARREQRQAAGSVRFSVADADNTGTRVSEAKGISKSYDGVPVVRDFSIRNLRGDRLGIVGANGAGKTTLLNLLTGRVKPDSGEVKLGTNLKMATLDQNRALLDPETTLSAVLTGGVGDTVEVGGRSRHVVSYMKDFLFLPEQARTPVRVLSGGERARLLLAKALATPSNLLVLDEPTNDLDLETLDLLEEMIADYPGTALIVSHDRDFLDRVVTSVLMAEGNGRFVEYAGGYSDMVAQRGLGVVANERVRSPPARASVPNEGRNNDAPRRKLAFAEKHALDTLPATISALTEEIAGLQARLSDSAFYGGDGEGFLKLSSRLSEAQRELAGAEERWLELEMRREDMERLR